MYEQCVTAELYAAGGYLADDQQSPGTCIGAFTNAHGAAMWGLKCIARLKCLAW